MENGSLVISLDFELLWGVFDKVDYNKKIDYFENTRQLIPSLLQVFEKYKIHCTWATVGMLFNSNWDDWNANIPANLPNYKNQNLSAYTYGKSIQSKKTEKLCFAPNLIKKIKNTKGQEIGTHTYSHYYCLEPGQDSLAFKADIEKAIELASIMGIDLKSLVFPRNQYNSAYLEICEKSGLNTVRTNPENWYWQNTQKDSIFHKIFRTGDAYFGAQDKTYKSSQIHRLSSQLTGQKASRLLRSYSGRKVLDNLKLKRIYWEMEYAAKNKENYHLWWHPHNFGNNPLQNLEELKLILDYYCILRDKYGFKSRSMGELAMEYIE
ncbi:polysaccharide deacetylase [Salegentibacter salinarum]|uniref:Polysaccharide deacetylase n=1 Tax=Salegentibacter salinarum TaxID=447422 RepID=A0A2N0TPW4_9FLAO|nr:polysaccharide deacetylase family protein [Salegentibacter salinarum]PKD16764.1 polysaccharide deacetylase [Salegentibacter salinarum]SKB59375.1 Polysaccharide deacetylase [Salegentibacter salinarum]